MMCEHFYLCIFLCAKYAMIQDEKGTVYGNKESS